QVALATVELSERIATADWGDLGGGALRLRIPTKCPTMTAACLDNPSNYQWDQYRLSGGTLWLHTDTGAGCGGGRVIARNVLFTVSFNGTGNAIDYAVLWDNGLAGSRHRTHEFRGHVASRLRAAPGGSLAPAPGLPPVC
ncbi:MAG: hypothetical protein HYT90_03860, partial [Candidatus Omnitrophica bacterium]|nr:hypothetical protein [Candidatus Omnitrophota bacterium]